MKIAITADIHLKADGKYPERFNALKNICDQLLIEGIENLIIAGDLFDIESQNYALFDELCKNKKYSNIKFYIIPGNHDLTLNQKHFTAENIKVFSQPCIANFNDCPTGFLFIPYTPGKPMGEIIAKYRQALPEGWILIGHGDYLSGIRDIKDKNTYEVGIYMPLARTDIEFYTPSRVILGHIHKSVQLGKVYYPGSPCSMDINETGRRNFFTLDLNDLAITSKTVDTDYIFFNETFIALPLPDEFDYVKNRIAGIIESWKLSKDEIPKARIRLKVKGFTSDKKRLEKVIKETLSGFSFYNNEEPDLTEVCLFNEPERISIVERMKEKIDLLEENAGFLPAKKEHILEQALSLILQD